MEEYCPEIFEMIKKRVKSGNWEITASMWVEGDKNIVSGESLCRHLLYTRKYMKEKFDLEPEDVKIDWSPDTFGHAHTVPSILARGGVNRYYFHRTGPAPVAVQVALAGWVRDLRVQGPRQATPTTARSIPADMAQMLVSFTKETGLKDYHVYLRRRRPRRRPDPTRPPQVPRGLPSGRSSRPSSTAPRSAFFDAVEKANPKLPVVDADLNFTFEGCYTVAEQHQARHPRQRDHPARGRGHRADRGRGREDALSVRHALHRAGGTRCSITSTTSCRAPAFTRPTSTRRACSRRFRPPRARSAPARCAARQRRSTRPSPLRHADARSAPDSATDSAPARATPACPAASPAGTPALPARSRF